MTYGGPIASRAAVADENAAPGKEGAAAAGNARKPFSDIGNVVGAFHSRCNVGKDGVAKVTRSKAKAAVLAEKTLVGGTAANGRTLRPRDPNTGTVVGGTTTTSQEAKPERRSSRSSSGRSMSGLLQARSESARTSSRRSSASLSSHADQPVSSPLPDIDSQDRHNYLCETEYVQDIYSYYKAVEGKYAVQDYMQHQPDINDKMRAILIDWLVEVHLKFRLMPETLFLTVQIIDRYLAIDRVSRKNLQLVGVTGMLIASKYEEIWAPEVRDFVFICDRAYSRDQILGMEKVMLNKLQFKITCPTSYHFLARFIKACGVTEKKFNMLCMYGVELSFPEYKFRSEAYSKMAAAAVLVARQSLATGPWTNALEKHSGYTQKELQPLADEMRGLMVNAGGKDVSLKAVHKKYSNARFYEVAKIVN